MESVFDKASHLRLMSMSKGQTLWNKRKVGSENYRLNEEKQMSSFKWVHRTVNIMNHKKQMFFSFKC